MRGTDGKWLGSGTLAVALLVGCGSPSGADEAGAAASAEQAVRNAIVKIHVATNRPDYFRPWNMFTEQVSGSGCVIAGQRILTNAHVVANATFIEVQRRGQAGRFRASVESVSHEKDLALLRVGDTSFFEGVEPLELGALPRVQQQVLVLGFPLGGTTLSATQGVVSRVEHVTYAHCSVDLLAVQIDAAVNPGNSGGPAIADGRVVGIVMQANPMAENIGYIVPSTMVRHLLTDLGDGRLDGVPSLGLAVQTMESPDLRRRYGLGEHQSGVLVTHVQPESPARGKIAEGDVLLGIEGHPIASDGSVEFRPGERTWFTHYVELHQRNEQLALEVSRDGRARAVELVLAAPLSIDHLVGLERYDEPPRFFVFGGIVFSPLTKSLLGAWGGHWQRSAPPDLVHEASRWPSDESREEVVALQVLAGDVNQGYHDFRSWLVRKVNGETYRDFDEFYRRVTSAAGPFVSFEDEQGTQVVIDREKALATHQEILETYRVKYDRSPDLSALDLEKPRGVKPADGASGCD